MGMAHENKGVALVVFVVGRMNVRVGIFNKSAPLMKPLSANGYRINGGIDLQKNGFVPFL